MVNQNNFSVLIVNSGSSSLKFALFEIDSLQRILAGKIDRIGLPGATLTVEGITSTYSLNQPSQVPHHTAAADLLITWLKERIDYNKLAAIGHRIVHGGSLYSKPQRITRQMMDDLLQFSSFNPIHLPNEIRVIEAFQQEFPLVEQMACFDTEFHESMPAVAKLLPVPRRYHQQGIRRYGFHGLSYTYLMHELEHLCGTQATNGRIILAHLGNGASMAAVSRRQSMDTSMSLTPVSGLVMSTRSGDLDPGLISLLVNNENMTPEQFDHMVNHESGLLGISETSADIRDLLANRSRDVRAAEAIDIFCYQARKYIGAYATTIAGLDILVFSGGIGENSPEIRSQICEGLGFMGIELDTAKNSMNAPVISSVSSKVSVRVIATDEEWMMAQIVCGTLDLFH